jgi:hypothetical protein
LPAPRRWARSRGSGSGPAAQAAAPAPRQSAARRGAWSPEPVSAASATCRLEIGPAEPVQAAVLRANAGPGGSWCRSGSPVRSRTHAAVSPTRRGWWCRDGWRGCLYEAALTAAPSPVWRPDSLRAPAGLPSRTYTPDMGRVTIRGTLHFRTEPARHPGRCQRALPGHRVQRLGLQDRAGGGDVPGRPDLGG